MVKNAVCVHFCFNDEILTFLIGCGNTLSNGGTLAPEGLSGCNILCNGNASEYCGGTSRLNVYNFNGTFTPPTTPTTTTTVSPTAVPTAGAYVYYGCQTEGFNVRALGAKGTSSPTMTIETCEAFCSGYDYFGTEYGQECKSPSLEFGVILTLITRLLWKYFW